MEKLKLHFLAQITYPITWCGIIGLIMWFSGFSSPTIFLLMVFVPNALMQKLLDFATLNGAAKIREQLEKM
jgi:hypothetical protein